MGIRVFIGLGINHVALGVSILNALSTQQAHAEMVIHEWENPNQPFGQAQKIEARHLQLSLEGNYYLTSQNFDVSGTNHDVSGLNELSRFQTDLSVAFAWNSWLTTFLRISAASAHLDTSPTTSSQFGLADQSLGAVATVLENETSGLTRSRIDLLLRFDFPAYDNATARREILPFLGDASTDLSIGVFGLVHVAQLGSETIAQLTGGLGYTYRNQTFSDHLPWSLKIAALPLRQGFFVEGGFKGLISLQNDNRTSAPLVAEGSGGSFFTDAYNPSLVNTTLGIGYRFHSGMGPLTLKGEFQQSFMGVSAPLGTLFTAGIQLDLNASPQKTQAARTPPALFPKGNRGFVTYSLDAQVLKVNDRLNLVKINRGINEGVERGQIFDIFKGRTNGPDESKDLIPIARARVDEVKSTESVLSIQEYFKDDWIEEGFTAKRLVQ